MSQPTFQRPTGRSPAPRIASIAAASLLALLALGFFAGGAVVLWADSKKDDQGYISTGSERFSTSTSALATESLDLDLDGAESVLSPDRYGKLRLKVSPRSDEPVFVGIARSDAVDRYLRGTAHTTVTDVSYSPFRADYRDHGGDRRAAPPAAQRFWDASATGAGAQTLTWNVEDGKWSIVVMNADGSPGVDAGVSAGAKVPFLAALGWSLIGGGVVLLVAAGGLVYVGVRMPVTRGAQAEMAAA